MERPIIIAIGFTVLSGAIFVGGFIISATAQLLFQDYLLSMMYFLAVTSIIYQKDILAVICAAVVFRICNYDQEYKSK